MTNAEQERFDALVAALRKVAALKSEYLPDPIDDYEDEFQIGFESGKVEASNTAAAIAEGCLSSLDIPVNG